MDGKQEIYLCLGEHVVSTSCTVDRASLSLRNGDVAAACVCGRWCERQLVEL